MTFLQKTIDLFCYYPISSHLYYISDEYFIIGFGVGHSLF
jgi:hypothetical protein